jgi:hypothetical protein
MIYFIRVEPDGPVKVIDSEASAESIENYLVKDGQVLVLVEAS